jgi:hypothetical protein
MIFLSTSLLHKVAENVEWMVNAGFRQPFLKLSAEYVVRRRFDSSPITGPASTSGASSPHINSRFGGGANSRVAASTSSTQMSEVASELQESTEELPTQFAKVKMALSNMDASTELVEGVVGQSAGNSERLIDADLSIALVNGMHGAVALADKVLPAETLASLPTSNQIMPFLTGAHLVLNCIKVALDPTVLMKEHTMLLTITVKTLDLVEHVKRTSADMRSADGDDDDDADADDDGGYYSDGGDEGFHQDDDDDDDNNNNNNNSDDRNLAR